MRLTGRSWGWWGWTFDPPLPLLLLPLLPAVVAWLAQRLPVAGIPEPIAVALVRDDVVNHGCRYCLARLSAMHTQRIATQVSFPRLAPAAVVATLVA